MIRRAPVAEELAVHGLNGCIRCLEALVGHKPEAARRACFWVTHNLGRCNDDAEGAECVIEQLQQQMKLSWTVSGVTQQLSQCIEQKPGTGCNKLYYDQEYMHASSLHFVNSIDEVI